MNPKNNNPPSQPTESWNMRTVVCVLSTLFVSLPMPLVSIEKVLLVLFALGYGLHCMVKKRTLDVPQTAKVPLLIVLIALIAFLLSMLHTDVDMGVMWWAMAKHAKLLMIVALALLIRSQWEARRVLIAFLAGQILILTLSYLPFLGLPLPWHSTTFDQTVSPYVVFATSYIDQSIMLVLFAVFAWHGAAALNQKKSSWWFYALRILALIALFEVLFLLPGRTGYVAAITAIVLAAIWISPKKYWLPIIVLLPCFLVALLYFSDARTHTRIKAVVTESHAYEKHNNIDSSSGQRLNMWHRSLQALETKPLTGYGVGSWEWAAKQFQGQDANQVFGPTLTSNPHSEYLLWSVELGIGGPLLLAALLFSLYRCARQSKAPHSQIMLITTTAVVALVCLMNSSLFDDQIGDFLCVALGLAMALCAHPLKGIENHRTETKEI